MVDMNKYLNDVGRIADALERLAGLKDMGAVALPKNTKGGPSPTTQSAPVTAKKEAEDEW